MDYTIKQVSEKTKLKAHVLRYYEKEGLLPFVGRSESGIRHYTEDDLEWLGLICCLKNTGMAIKQIKEFVALSMQGGETLKQRCEMLVEHKKEVEAQIEEIQKHLRKVDHKIAYFTEQYERYKSDYAFYLPVFQAMQKLRESGRPIIIAIDGRCASGKSMLAQRLSEVFAGNVFHMDDFFLPASLQTKERFLQPGENVDYERFKREVLTPLTEGRDVCYQPFDCVTGKLKPRVFKPFHSISIVEGSYALHPALASHYDFRVFLTCSPEMQEQRLSHREGDHRINQFLEKWIPLEEQYFNACAISKICDLELDTTDFFDL